MTDDPPADHPLRRIIEAAAAGRPPEPDWTVEVIPPPPGSMADGVLAFAAHHVVAADVDAADVAAALDPDDVGAPVGAPFLSWLARRLGRAAGTLDVVLAAPAVPLVGSLDALVPIHPVRPDPSHPRIARAIRYRRQIRVWETWDGAGVLIVGRGVAGRWEAAFEVEPAARGRGVGRGLAAAAMRLIPPGQAMFVQVAPGNVPSLRAVLAAGYVPIGAEVLFPRT